MAVRGGILLFDLFYRPGMTDAQIAYTVDNEYMEVRSREYRLGDGDLATRGPPVRFSVSHMAPNVQVPTKYRTREPMFYNTDIDRVLRAHGSRVHRFGHTHEWADAVVDGVRYVNRPVGYEAPRGRLEDFVVTV
ncbi:MAG TPA: hypothetical protein VGB42_11520 [Candidatus Thermoplasmatota archaeon]